MSNLKLNSCAHCHGGETRIDESTYFSGMTMQVLSVTLRHFCEQTTENTFKTTITIRERTAERAAQVWNSMNE